MDKRLHVIGIFFDLTKAYDMIDHNILLEKLNSYGIRGFTNVWFKSYLANRVQIVEISHWEKNNTQSKYTSLPREATHGVPQGSILGTLLYCIVLCLFSSISIT
jgi:sarcosine oxidase/L-pipecolate oxidase